MPRMQFIANGLRYTPYTEKVERQNDKTGYWEPHQEGIDIANFLKGAKEIKIVNSGLSNKPQKHKPTGNDSNSILSDDMAIYDYKAIAASEVSKITFTKNASPPKAFVKIVSNALESSSALRFVEGIKVTKKLKAALSGNDRAYKQREADEKWKNLWETDGDGDDDTEGAQHASSAPDSSDADTDWEALLGAPSISKDADEWELTLAVLGQGAEGWKAKAIDDYTQ